MEQHKIGTTKLKTRTVKLKIEKLKHPETRGRGNGIVRLYKKGVARFVDENQLIFVLQSWRRGNNEMMDVG